VNARSLLPALTALIAACEHPVPYDIASVEPNPPLTGTLRQVTFNAEAEWSPAWLPDGSGVGFSWMDPVREDRDRCIAFMPPEGGRIFEQLCPRAGFEWESLNVASTHGVSPGGRIAVVGESSRPRVLAPANRYL